MKLKYVGTYDEGIKLFRFIRLSFRRTGSSFRQLSVGFRANKLFGFTKGYKEWFLTMFGIRFHYRAVFGGRCAD